MIAEPFRGLRPPPNLAARVASPPYDVLTDGEARALARDPHSFVHVIRPEVDLDPAIDPHDDAVYAKGRANFGAMIERGWLVPDVEPAYYVYRLTRQGHAQSGVLAAAAVSDYREDRIRKHELTRPDKEQDRVRLGEALEAHPGPVFLMHRPHPALEQRVGGITELAPDVAFTADDGVRHELWVVADPSRRQALADALEDLPQAYIADGHHRAAAAAQLAARRGAAAGRFLAAWFPAAQLRVLDYNRVVRDLNGHDPVAFLEQVRARGFEVVADHAARRPPGPRAFGAYLAGRWYLLRARPELVPQADPVGRLDVTVLGRELLEPVLGIRDPRTDPRIDFVGGGRGIDELQQRVDRREAAVAFVLWPTNVEDVMDVADAGAVMPPKSTWFEPKLRSGLVVQRLEHARALAAGDSRR